MHKRDANQHRFLTLRKSVGVFVLVTLLILISFQYVMHRAIIVDQSFHYIFKAGETTQQFSDDLYQAKLIRFPRVFRLLARLNRVDHALQAGEYLFPVGTSIHDIFRMMSSGKVRYYRFMLINGWNIYQVMDALSQANNLQHTLLHSTPQEVALKLGIHYKTPEGWLYPETYQYKRGDTDLMVLQQAYQLMRTTLAQAWQQREKGLSYRSPYQALIVASMVEKEAAVQSEKPIIAAIILKRLKKWMPLQIDATVIYGLEPHFNGNLTKGDLRRKTPYNTYLNYGLPVSPIAMPGIDSIQAALHPTKTDDWYYVSTGDGAHVFSKTLEEHNRQVEQYQIKKLKKD